MSQINRVPFGLQSLLNSKNFGENPNNLLKDVYPVLDMEPFLSGELTRYARRGGPTSFAAAGSLHQFEVPEGEIWDVRSVACLCTNNANVLKDDQFSVQIVASDLVGSTDPLADHPLRKMGTYVVVDPTDLSDSVLSWYPPQPLYFGPGTIIKISANQLILNPTGTFALQTTIRYVALEV